MKCLIDNLIEIKSGQEFVSNLSATRIYDASRGWGRFWTALYSPFPKMAERACTTAWTRFHRELQREIPLVLTKITLFKEQVKKIEIDPALRNFLALWRAALPKKYAPELEKPLKQLKPFFVLEDRMRKPMPVKVLLEGNQLALCAWMDRVKKRNIPVRLLHKAIKTIARIHEVDSEAILNQLWHIDRKKLEESDPKMAGWHQARTPVPKKGIVMQGCNAAILPIWFENLANHNPFGLELPSKYTWGVKRRSMHFPDLTCEIGQHALPKALALVKYCLNREIMPDDLQSIACNSSGHLVLTKPMHLCRLNCVTLDNWLYQHLIHDRSKYQQCIEQCGLIDHAQIRFLYRVLLKVRQGHVFKMSDVSMWDQIDNPEVLKDIQLLTNDISQSWSSRYLIISGPSGIADATEEKKT